MSRFRITLRDILLALSSGRLVAVAVAAASMEFLKRVGGAIIETGSARGGRS